MLLQWSAGRGLHLADYRAALMVYCDGRPKPAGNSQQELDKSELLLHAAETFWCAS
jgi:hypothetical protein